MSEENKAIVQQAYESFKSGNIEALLGLMSDNITWTLPEMTGVPFSGQEPDAMRLVSSLLPWARHRKS